VGNPCDPERDQQRQRRFGSVRSGGQGIEAENRDSGGDANVFGALFAGGQGSAK
jgi:hypothetical protein